jgi:hypothetical protein
MPKLPALVQETGTIRIANEHRSSYTVILAHSRIKVSCIQVYDVNSFAFDSLVQCVLRRRPEVPAMEIPEDSG